MQAVKIYENHGQDSRIRDCGQLSPTVSRKYGTGGNNVPLVVRCVLDMQGGKSGCHISDGSISPTITRGRASVNDVHLVCIGRRV